MPEASTAQSAARSAHVPLIDRRWTLEMRQHMGWRQQAGVLAIAILTGLGISAAILIAAGVSASDLVQEFIVHTFFDLQSLQAVLFQAAPMILIGLAACVAFRARFWNLGLEGQMIWGAIAATAVSLADVGPQALRLPLMMVCACAAGLAWVVVPALLRLRLGVSEIIATLMTNYLASNFLLHLVYGSWKDPKDAFPHSPAFREFERLPELAGGIGSALPLAIVVALAAWWWVEVSRSGLYLRVIHAHPRVADGAGIATRSMILGAVLVSGAIAGLGGFVVAAGQEGRLTQGFYNGYGFSGILIAFLARNHPIAAAVVAVLVAGLFVTGRSLQVFYQIPFSVVQLIQAIIVICVAASEFFIRHRLRPVARAHG